MHVYRWDLDKTYLETDFDSLRGLVKSATEPAGRKRAVPGAAALARALGRDLEHRTFVLSGSPLQMRAVLEEKLRLDGVRFERLVLKDNLSNLRRGRLRAVREQFGYKLPALFEARAATPAAARETLFGDDAEQDALVYSVYADAVAGRIDEDQVALIMRAAGAYPDRIARATSCLGTIPRADAVDRIFIRLERKVPAERFAVLGRRVVPVHSWWQAALVLVADGRLAAEDAVDVLGAVMGEDALDAWALAGLTQDIVRRGHVARGAVDALADVAATRDRGLGEIVDACRRGLSRMVERNAADDGANPGPSEYLDLVRRWGR